MAGGHSLFGTRAAPSLTPPPHRSAGFRGAQSLSNPNTSKQFNTSTGTSLSSWSFWFRVDAHTPGNYDRMIYVGDGTGNAAGAMAGVQIDGPTSNVVFFASNGGASFSQVGQPGFVPVLGKWYFMICGWGTGTTGYVELWDQFGPMPGASTAFLGPVNNPSGTLTVGSGPVSPFVVPFVGEIDSLGFWPSRLLTNAEATALWNNGRALDFAGLPASLLTGLQAYYNLDDRNGSPTWIDQSANANLLTAAGFVTSQSGAGY